MRNLVSTEDIIRQINAAEVLRPIFLWLQKSDICWDWWTWFHSANVVIFLVLCWKPHSRQSESSRERNKGGDLHHDDWIEIVKDHRNLIVSVKYWKYFAMIAVFKLSNKIPCGTCSRGH